MSSKAKTFQGEEEPASFAVSSDRQSYGQIQMFFTYASLAMQAGDFDGALMNVEFAWQRLPNKIKSHFVRPMLVYAEKLEQMPTEEQLWNDVAWQESYGGKFKAEVRYMEAQSNRLKLDTVNDCLDKFNQALDEAGLSWKETGGGLEAFGNYGDSTKGLGFEEG